MNTLKAVSAAIKTVTEWIAITYEAFSEWLSPSEKTIISFVILLIVVLIPRKLR